MTLPSRIAVGPFLLVCGIGIQFDLASPVATKSAPRDAPITTEVAKLTASDASAGDFFGFSVSADGDTMVVGARADDDAGSSAGSVYVFQRNAGGADRWGQVAKLTAIDAAPFDRFGSAVSISGDTVVVGATGDDDGGASSGSAYVFERNVGGADRWGQVAKLTAADAAEGDAFGSSVSISYDRVIVGAVSDNDAGVSSGSSYVFERNTGGADRWGQVAKLTALDAAEGDQFGLSVSISGGAAVVGARGNSDAGAASGSSYVFGRNAGGANHWGQVAKLTASDAEAGDLFGESVSISGDTVIVGARFSSSGGIASGASYVFERNAGGVDGWGQVAKLTASDAAVIDGFGSAVSISADRVIVGVPNDDDDGSFSGSSYVFARNAGGAGRWGQVAKLTASDAAEGDRFGMAASISGDTLIVGSRFDDHAGEDSGSAYAFTVSGCEWLQAAKPVAADAATGDFFGHSVSISGDTAVVGAVGDDDGDPGSGSAYVLGRNVGGTDRWGQVAKLAASDPAAGGQFGNAVSISSDTVVVGAFWDDEGGPRSGSAYVFGRNAGGADRWGQIVKLTAPVSFPGHFFGSSVSISGDRVVVGAPGNNSAGSLSGAAFVFERNAGGADSWGQVAKLTALDDAGGDEFGSSVSISGDTVVVGSYRDDDDGPTSGSGYVFKRNAGGADGWGQIAKLTASDAAGGDEFGFAVSISGDTVVVGAYRDDDAGLDSGSSYVFERNAGGADQWGQVAKLTAADVAAGDGFGLAAAISVDTIVVGAPFGDDGGSDSGASYVFERNAGGADRWGQVAQLRAPDAAASDQLGHAVSISGDTVVTGAPLADGGASASGSSYVFTFACTSCGDGIVGSGEECDDGAGNSDTMPDACRTDCVLPSCGDAVQDSGEACDDGNTVAGDGCDATCAIEFCGDGIVNNNVDEECDDGVESATCDADCTLATCGDNTVNTSAGEACDDGNLMDGDGCSSRCLVEGACCTNAAPGQSTCVVVDRPLCETNHSLFLGEGSTCGAEVDCVALAVTIDSMFAELTSEGVVVRWTTAMEMDTVAFRLLREMPDRREARTKSLVVVATAIAAKGNALEGADYRFVDDAKGAPRALHYFLEDVDVFGRVTRHGPIVINRGAGRVVGGGRPVRPIPD